MARALGISRAAVDKCRDHGMPMHSVEAARAWREQHLHPARMKRAPQAATLTAWPGGPAQLIDDLQWFARTAAEYPDDPAWLYAVHELLRLVDDEQFGAVRLPVAVWARLLLLWGAPVQTPALGQVGSA